MSDVVYPHTFSIPSLPEEERGPMFFSSFGRDPSLYDEKDEMLLKEDHNRFVLFPIKHWDIWKLYKKAEACIWHAHEIKLEEDIKTWNNTLNDGERRFISHVLAFFAGSDGIVLENAAKRLLVDIKIPEGRAFISLLLFVENVHSETYCSLIDAFIKNMEEKRKLFDAMNEMPSVRAKAKWAVEWMDSSKSFAERLFAYILVEGLFFSGSFCAIFWLRKRGLMPGLTFSNDLISRDEGLHYDFTCLLYSKLDWKLAPWRALEILHSALEVERLYVADALPEPLLGMNSDFMIQYVEYVADKILTKTGYSKTLSKVNPFDWMETISMDGKTNFFERQVSAYQKSGVLSSSQEREERENGIRQITVEDVFDGEIVDF